MTNDKNSKKAPKRKVTVDFEPDAYQNIESILDVRTDAQAAVRWYLVRSGYLVLGIVELVVYIVKSSDGHYVMWANRVDESIDKDLALAAIRAMHVSSKYENKLSISLGENDFGMKIETETVSKGVTIDVFYQDGNLECITIDEDLYNTFPLMWHEYATRRKAAFLAINRTSTTLQD